MARPQTVSDDQILNVARECFMRHGPGVSTDVIAQHLNVSPQALLKRFGNKHSLMMAALGPITLNSVVPALEKGPDNRPVDVQLMELLEQVAEFYVEMARRISVLRWRHEDCQELMRNSEEPPPIQNMKLLAGWLERAWKKRLIRKCEFQGVALMILSALHGPAMLTDLLGDHPTGHTSGEYVRILVGSLLRGIAASDPQSKSGSQRDSARSNSVDSVLRGRSRERDRKERGF